MRTLLRHTETGLYFQGAERWTTTPEIAYDFRFVDRARHFVQLWEMENVEIVFAFEDAQSSSTVLMENCFMSAAA